jgi:pyruvate,orthophosphate dikinase
MRLAAYAVFDSWNSDRAKKYMAINGIVGLKGTAVNIQAMVFGNMGDTSGTGVCFTRNPSTGENLLYGEYLVNAQGEDVVAGIRTPEDILRMREALPEAYEDLVRNTQLLEKHYKDMQDIEFTVQEGKLFMLQTRSGKRTGAGAVKIAVDLVGEGLIDEKSAIGIVEPTHIDQLLHPQFRDEAAYAADVIGVGLPASPGAAVGQVVFDTPTAEELHSQGKKCILVRVETSPEDVGGMNAAEGILTARGGMTSHAAVVARGWGKTCVSGCAELVVDEENRWLSLGGVKLHEGDWVSLNGSTGEVIRGAAELAPPAISGDLGLFMSWVDAERRLKVLANADTPEDAAVARENGAEGIGLVRTEHMFFGSGERIRTVRRMIMASATPEREAALKDLLPFQRSDFAGIFAAMDGLPVTIRLLDPPLHEFLPDGELDEIVALLAADTGASEDDVVERVEKLAEINPMLGFRGCRLAITYPEIGRMQVRAIFEAACDKQSEGIVVKPDIMVPLVGTVKELEHQINMIRDDGERGFRRERDRRGFSRRDDDRDPARRVAVGRHRVGGRGVLLLRHERPDADDVRVLAGRRLEVPAHLPRAGHPETRPLPGAGPGGRRAAHRDVGDARASGAARPQGGHLRRARRRPRVRGLLPQAEPGLRLVLALPRPHRQARGGAGGAQGAERVKRGVVFFVNCQTTLTMRAR